MSAVPPGLVSRTIEDKGDQIWITEVWDPNVRGCPFIVMDWWNMKKAEGVVSVTHSYPRPKSAAAWQEKVKELIKRIGREPRLEELLELCKGYKMTEEEIKEQCASWVRGMMPTGDPRFD